MRLRISYSIWIGCQRTIRRIELESIRIISRTKFKMSLTKSIDGRHDESGVPLPPTSICRACGNIDFRSLHVCKQQTLNYKLRRFIGILLEHVFQQMHQSALAQSVQRNRMFGEVPMNMIPQGQEILEQLKSEDFFKSRLRSMVLFANCWRATEICP